MKLTRRRVLAASAAATLAAPAVQASPGWPTKGTIKLIATFPPGGTADTISRILAPKLAAGLGTRLRPLTAQGSCIGILNQPTSWCARTVRSRSLILELLGA